MPDNKNCLDGFRCPQCGATELIKTVAKAIFEVTDDGAECVGDVEWDDDSFCECGGCHCKGKVSNFTVSSSSISADNETSQFHP